MSEQAYFPIDSSRLRDNFPELKHFILSDYARTITLKRGGSLAIDQNDELLYLAKGKIKAYMYDEDGHEQLMYIFIKDTIIFHAISEQFCKDLVALEAATLYSVHYDALFRFLQTDADYIRKFSTLIATRYGILLQQVLTTNRQCARRKIYAFLVSLVHKFGSTQPDGSILVSKVPTLTDIAALVGVHRSNATSYINELEAQGILTRQKRQLIVHDLPALEALLEEGT